ncbi:hypothetical protein GGR25_002176 [Kaistia hirudinis]|uniref:DUF3320 domain-containing protein n=1 Tax=Kaistia hirudinis TaxID=1293440 RepID=A0A840ARX3_9HYPH|nr:DUF3320 domain-containing protein [Kaistia hirudinis]MBB3931126.1 hypothetical protein [Kaistia hirudinis]
MREPAKREERPARDGRLARLLADVRQRLIETGTRNRLVHAARFGKRGKSIDIFDERSDDTFHILLRSAKPMRFSADPSAIESTARDEPVLTRRWAGEIDPERYTDQLLQTRLGPDKLHKRLLGLAREAKTLEEEQGINALYMALGFLRWYEDEASDVIREAPLVLLPVSLVRNPRTSLYEVVAREEDLLTNEPLKRRLQDEFNIRLPEIPESDDWSPSDYFASVADAVSPKPRWTIEPDGMQLGFFSFAKLLMVKDLEPENWSEGGILDHPIVAGLLQEGFEAEAEDFPDDSRLDSLFAPADLVQIVDADASQTLVIETVRKGRNLIVQGPPGTGKSQTITNIIAAAAHDGKRVLFVAEKMAALNVVHDRLKKAGVQDICLELHSRSANKKQVLAELERTLEASSAFPANGLDTAELTQLRDRLNKVAAVMHQPIGETGFTPYQVLSTLIGLSETNLTPPDIEVEGIANWSRQDRDAVLQAVGALAKLTEKAGPRLAHPFYGVGNTKLLPTDIQRLLPKLENLVNALGKARDMTQLAGRSVGSRADPSQISAEGLSAVVRHIAALSPLAAPFAAIFAAQGGSAQARALIEAGRAFQRQRASAGPLFIGPALAAPIDHLRQRLAAGHSLLGRLSGEYRSGSAELSSLLTGSLPKSQPDRVALYSQLVDLQQAGRRLAELKQTGAAWFGPHWRDEDTDFESMSEAADWVSRLLSLAVELNPSAAVQLRQNEPQQLLALSGHVESLGQTAMRLMEDIARQLAVDVETVFSHGKLPDVPFDLLSQKAQIWLDQIDRLEEWSQLDTADAALRALSGSSIADAVSAGYLLPEQASDTVRYLHAEALYRQFAAGESWATQLTAEEKAEMVASFKALETARRRATARMIRGNHVASIPRGGMGAMGIVRGEIGKRRAHKPIRRLMSEAGAVIQQIKPVFLMSPISVAQFLPPNRLEFDLLVIDEASQIRPEDAFGAIARSKQIVVVGDKEQLPPTSFFDKVVSNDEDEPPDDEDENPAPPLTAAAELESILKLCDARGLNSKMLKWHYRSRHASLIEVSNDEFYKGELVLFPSPSMSRETDGLAVRRVMGAYDRGGKRNNPIEAEAIAQAVAAHARIFPGRSLGVVTFSTTQRDQVTYWLDKLRQTDADLDAFMREGRDEEFFVKNIENVQGDERDVIYISVGYGPRTAGSRLDSMAFGPISTEGGERRLNVLFTRARYRTEVFVSFQSGDIDLARSRSVGARVFKRFLQYGETGVLAEPRALGADPDSEFEVAVADVVRAMGHAVDLQVGSAGFKIDMAVHHPERLGQYMLAIECDGATYHSAVWARERDRLRQEVLEELGWRFHRVWSTDWFHRRSDEVRRLQTALRDAVNHVPHRPVEPADPEPEPYVVEEEPGEDVKPAPSSGRQLPEYVLADFPIPFGQEPHEVSIRELAPILQRIIEIEGPIHQEEVARRLAGLFGKQKAGSRIAASVSTALRHLKSVNREILAKDEFWCTTTQLVDVPLRNRSRAPLSLRKASMLAPIEISAAIRTVLDENGALPWNEIARAVAFLFGFQRTGPEFRPAIEPIAEEMLRRGEIVEGAAGISLAPTAS